MKSKIIAIAGELGGYQLARLLTRAQPKILMYHRFSEQKKGHEVTAATFEKQLQLIKRYFNPITLAGLSESINARGKAPAHSVVITVDDGYRDFYEVAFPLLKHYQVPATFFVTTGFVNGDIWLWPDQVLWLLNNRNLWDAELSVGNRSFDLSQSTQAIWWPLVLHLLTVDNSLRLQALVDLQELAGIALPAAAPLEYAAVNWQQLREMQANGIEIGGHTLSHPSLGHMDLDAARAEINTSFSMLQDQLGSALRTFCYPNGQPADYSPQVKQLVAESGFTAAVTAYSDRFNIDLPWAWRRFVGCEESFQFNKSLFGVEHLGNQMRKLQRCDY